MPLLDGLKVIASSIHGYGVITTRPFKTGETICFGDGVLYTKDAEFDDTYALIMDGDDSGLGDHYFWDLVCQTRWFNHSCDPNCEAVITRGRIWIEALKPIAAGTELVYDYQYEDDPEYTEEDLRFYACRCGAPNCRGTIVKTRRRLSR